MVEARLDPIDDPLRVTTPTPMPGGYFLPKEVNFESRGTPGNSTRFHDTGDLATPTIHSEFHGHTNGSNDIAPHSVHGDASEGMSEPSKSDHTKAGSPSHRRRPRSQLVNSQRPSGQHPPQPPSSHGFAISSSSSSENIHNHPPPGFQGSSIHYASATVPYNQRGGYVGQYTMSAQPSPMNMAHSPSPYAFSHTYHHPVAPDNNSMITQNIHANYPPMLQPHAPVFAYQRHSPEGSSTAHPSFSGTRNSPMYSPHQLNTPSSPTSPQFPSSAGQSGALTPSYGNSNPFHSLQYPTPMSTAQYGYPAQTYPPSPMYQAPFAPSPFGQHYTPTGETEPQGTWYYLPHPAHNPSPQQYDAAQSYQGHYNHGYPQLGHSGVESRYAGPGPSSSANPSRSPPPYPIPPAQPHSAHNQTPSDSPRASGTGAPALGPGTVMAPHSASSSSGRPPVSDRPLVRRSYHPNPPAHRSEWVMWAGNVPPDASHDELWRFFNQVPEHRVDDADATTGVLSIFLISRSSCAFVNYENEAFLQEAITRFNGVPLRPNDPRCARLVCRVRRKDDDLKAGVGGQRGLGMHTKWIKEQKGKEREVAASDRSELSSDDPSISPTSVSSRLANAVSTLSMSSDEDGKRGVHAKHSSSSGSYTSTNSSFLARHFPKRYFILKSLTQEDLDTSVERNVWATQKHNEEILDQAYRTSKEVHLIFSVNKSGEFYGYARMAGPVRRGEQRVSWASRPPQASPPSRVLGQNLGTSPMRTIFSPSDHRFVDNSPLPVSTGATPLKDHPGRANVRHSAPALLGEGYHLPTLKTPTAMHSLDQARRFQVDLRGASGQEDFELDASAPGRAMRGKQGSSSGSSPGSGSDGQEKPGSRAAASLLRAVEEEEERVDEQDLPVVLVDGERGDQAQEERKAEEAWGDSFAVEWICTDRLPFHRTKHLRNPWNHDREIKISRDGTELEPTVGHRLLDEWAKLSDPQLPPSTEAGKPAGGKRAAVSKSLPPHLLAEEVERERKEGPPRSR